MANPNEVKYSKSHEWVEMTSDTTATIGLTDFAQHSLGDLVFVNLPEEGDEAEMDVAICDVESVKAVSDVFSPLTGNICAVNEELSDNPAKINEAPYDAWLFKVDNITECEDLMTLEQYEAFCKEEV